MRTVFGFLLTVFWVGVAAAEAPPAGFGPISLRNQFPLYSSHLTSAPDTPAVLREGGWRADLGASVTNSLISREEELVVDGEHRELRARLGYGLTERLELGVEIPFISRGGGGIDSFLDSWHKAFGLPRGERDTVPDNLYEISAMKNDGTEAGLDQTGTEFGNPILSAKYRLTDGDTGPLSALRFEASFPGSDSEYAHDGIDLHLGALAAERSGDWTLYGGVSYLWYSDTNQNDFEYRDQHAEGFFTIEYLAAEWFAPYVGVYLGSKTLDSLAANLEYSAYLDLGGKFRLDGAGLFLELLVREDLGPKDGTADVTLYTGIAYHA